MLDEGVWAEVKIGGEHLRLFSERNALGMQASVYNENTKKWIAPSETVDYEPAESRTALFGGNSNWRGPVWFPINFLLIEALQKFHHFYGDTLTVELPTGSGRQASLWQAAAELSRRLTRIFLRSDDGHRPVYGGLEKFQNDPYWRDLIYFHEYFHGDHGAGIGASHQTGWTGLVAKLIEQSGEGM